MLSPRSVVLNRSGTRDWFCGRQCSQGLGRGRVGLGIIRAHYIQAHLLLCGPVPNSPGSVHVRVLEFGDLCPKCCPQRGVARSEEVTLGVRSLFSQFCPLPGVWGLPAGDHLHLALLCSPVCSAIVSVFLVHLLH